MRVFLAGATGVIGIRLLPLLVARGHEVAAMTRDAANHARLEQLGASRVVCDVYDRPALSAAMAASRPEMVIHQLTDLPDDLDDVPAATAANSRIRQEGTSNLLDAARAAGATRFVAQSIAWEPRGAGAVAKLNSSAWSWISAASSSGTGSSTDRTHITRPHRLLSRASSRFGGAAHGRRPLPAGGIVTLNDEE